MHNKDKASSFFIWSSVVNISWPEKQAFCKYCWSNTCPLPAPNKFQIGITLQRIYERLQKWNLCCIMSIQIHTPNLISTSWKMTEKCGKLNLNKPKKISGVQLGQTQLDLYYVKTNSYTKFQVNITKIWKTIFLQRAITQFKIGQTRQSLNLTCIRSRQIHIRNFKSICQKMTKKSPENLILAKDSNSCKSRSNASKVELDLYYVKANSYTTFQVNITKDGREKFRKLNFFKGQ